LQEATRAVAEILDKYKNQVAEATLIPSSGGVFEVRVNGEPIFSKKETGRFPTPGELTDALARRLRAS
jgi:selenoprotein W-related protein